MAAAQGIVLDADPEELIDHAARPEVAYDHKASMLQDVEARRQTEIDYLNGGIVRFGREHGVPTPLNEAIAALVKGVEASWTQSRAGRVRERPRGDGATTASTRSSSPAASTAASRARSPTCPASDRAPLRVRRAPARGRAADRLPDGGALRRRARHGVDREQVFVDRPGEWIAATARDRGWRRSASTGSTT